jgi:Plasmid encoded RepA protein
LTPTARRLIDAAAEIMGEPDPTDRDRAFMARQLVQATLPHSDPGNVPIWTRTNGRLTLAVRPYYDRQQQRHLHPYGTVPRLLLFWLTTEAVRTRSRILYPGGTVSEFMRELGMNPGNGGAGAKRSDAHRLSEQMLRLFRAIISFELEDHDAGSAEWLDMQVVVGGKTWWDFREPTQGVLFESSIELGEKFYEALIAAPVPVDMRALDALKRSPLALDLYAWATYRTYTVTQAGKPTFIPWAALAAQIGGDYARLDNFVAAAKTALRKVQTVYPALRLGDAEGGFVLKPSASAVRSRAR